MTALSLPSTRFPVPAAATAPAPPEERGLRRDEVRLLVGRPAGLAHVRFHDLGDHLTAGDLLVVNNSATEPREVDGLVAGRPVVVHVGGRLSDRRWVVELRTSPDAAEAVLDASPGDLVTAAGVELELRSPYPDAASPTGEGNRLWLASSAADVSAALARYGRPIAYGYLDRRYPLADYQTVFGVRSGSAEMPSAARPFTPELVTRLVAQGVGIAPVTLHTGLSSQEAGEPPQSEWFEVTAATARLVNATVAGGGRVVAVGTSATRAIESAADGAGRVQPRAGWTDRVITPSEPPAVVSGLITGWHDPHASHLLLVEAVAGADLTQAAYEAAVAQSYLWHEFGDSALLLP